ncbi:MAG: lysozyme [Parvularculaceae bacterium]
MKISDNGLSLIKRFEGKVLEAYQDIAGIWTIGYGHTGSDVKPGMRISDEEADALLRHDVKEHADAVSRSVKVPLNQNEFDALVSFVYNIGGSQFRKSTALKRLNSENRLGAADALTWWNKATIGGVLREVAGLIRRRAAERALFLEPANPPIVTEPEAVEENTRLSAIEDPPRRPRLTESRTIQGATVAGGAGALSSTLGKNSAEDLSDIKESVKETGTIAPESEMAADLARRHDAEAQIQLALMILIVLAVVYVIYSRIEDWMRYRR